MNKTTKVLVLLVLAILVVAGCTPRGVIAPTGPVSTLNELIATLEAGGATVKQGEALQEGFFPVDGRILNVNNTSLSVWEFADVAAREAAQATIQGGGFIIGTAAVDWIDLPNFFAQGRLIVLYVGRDSAMIERLTGLLGETINPQTPPGTTIDQEPFALAARAYLAEQLGIPEDDIVFMAAEPVEWSDGCLGLGGPAESCLMAITPGYRVTFEARGASYEVRTDETGSVVRFQQ